MTGLNAQWASSLTMRVVELAKQRPKLIKQNRQATQVLGCVTFVMLVVAALCEKESPVRNYVTFGELAECAQVCSS